MLCDFYLNFFVCALWLRQVFVTEAASLLATHRYPPVSETVLPNPPKVTHLPRDAWGLEAGQERSACSVTFALICTFVLLPSHHSQNPEAVPAPEGCRYSHALHQGYHIWSSQISSIKNQENKNQHRMDSILRQNVAKQEEMKVSTRGLFKWVTKFRIIWKRGYILYCLLCNEKDKIGTCVRYFHERKYRKYNRN